jgi:GDP-L-fucose synthase
VPALIRKLHEAKTNGADHVVIWGTGEPRREFLYSDDAADACIFLMNLADDKFAMAIGGDHTWPTVNIGSGEDLTIRELSELISEVVGFEQDLLFDHSKPDGTPRKLLDVSRLRAMGWAPRVSLREGLTLAYDAFLGDRLIATASR